MFLVNLKMSKKLNIVEEKQILEGRQGEVLDSKRSEVSSASKNLYIESYGCQMNFSDSEVVASVMQENNFGTILLGISKMQMSF